jgi:hypothetical protein
LRRLVVRNNDALSPAWSRRRPSVRRSGSFENVHEHLAAVQSGNGKAGASFAKKRWPSSACEARHASPRVRISTAPKRPPAFGRRAGDLAGWGWRRDNSQYATPAARASAAIDRRITV